jgi:hypothetical protein
MEGGNLLTNDAGETTSYDFVLAYYVLSTAAGIFRECSIEPSAWLVRLLHV